MAQLPVYNITMMKTIRLDDYAGYELTPYQTYRLAQSLLHTAVHCQNYTTAS
jgi:hypothetical protein